MAKDHELEQLIDTLFGIDKNTYYIITILKECGFEIRDSDSFVDPIDLETYKWANFNNFIICTDCEVPLHDLTNRVLSLLASSMKGDKEEENERRELR